TGIAQPGNTGIPFKGIIGQPQLEILEQAKLQQSVHVLMAVRAFESIFDFKHAALYGFSRCRKRRPVRHRGDLIRWWSLRRLPRLGLCQSETGKRNDQESTSNTIGINHGECQNDTILNSFRLSTDIARQFILMKAPSTMVFALRYPAGMD